MSRPSRSSVRAALAGAAAALALAALLAGAPRPPAANGVDMTALAREVAREQDHVTALELARWIRDGGHRLRVIDVRDSTAYLDYHVPGAERHGVDELTTLPAAPEDTL